MSRRHVYAKPRGDGARRLKRALKSMEPRTGLVAELCRVFHASRVAMCCALRHGQVLVDGYIMREEYDHRWTPDQLKGRKAQITYYHTPQRRDARLYE